MSNPMVIDSIDVFERVVRKIAKETGHTFAEIMDWIQEDGEYIVPKEVFDKVYEKLYT